MYYYNKSTSDLTLSLFVPRLVGDNTNLTSNCKYLENCKKKHCLYKRLFLKSIRWTFGLNLNTFITGINKTLMILFLPAHKEYMFHLFKRKSEW